MPVRVTTDTENAYSIKDNTLVQSFVIVRMIELK